MLAVDTLSSVDTLVHHYARSLTSLMWVSWQDLSDITELFVLFLLLSNNVACVGLFLLSRRL